LTGYLLDTNIVLFALVAPDRLSDACRAAVLAGPNVLSAATYWEVVLQSMKGTLDIGDQGAWWSDALLQLAATPLAILPEHVGQVCSLPSIHKDPFDRILIAQAISEGLPLVTGDAEIARYRSDRLQIIS